MRLCCDCRFCCCCYCCCCLQVFLLTNSLWDYTHVVMNFLCGNSKKEERTIEWLDLFDVAITGACKVQYRFSVSEYCSVLFCVPRSGVCFGQQAVVFRK